MSSSSRRFTPASLRDFTAAARDLAKAYGLNLSQAQEDLARLYGFEDFHELRAVVRSGATPGPYNGESGLETAFARMSMTGTALVIEGQPVRWPVSRMDLGDLDLFGKPHNRRATMKHQHAIDIELDPNHQHVGSNLIASDYATFVEKDIDYIDAVGVHEGQFVLTDLGDRVWQALRYLSEEFDELTDPDERDHRIDGIERIMKNHPNNPYPGAVLVCIIAGAFNERWSKYDEDENFSEEEKNTARWLITIAKSSIKGFEELIPSGFKGDIEPKLIGYRIENFYYSSVLYWGGVTAHVAGDQKLAKQWMRKCRKASKRDPFGARLHI